MCVTKAIPFPHGDGVSCGAFSALHGINMSKHAAGSQLCQHHRRQVPTVRLFVEQYNFEEGVFFFSCALTF